MVEKDIMSATEELRKARNVSNFSQASSTFGKGVMYNQFPTAGMLAKNQGHVYLPQADNFVSRNQNDNVSVSTEHMDQP